METSVGKVNEQVYETEQNTYIYGDAEFKNHERVSEEEWWWLPMEKRGSSGEVATYVLFTLSF